MNYQDAIDYINSFVDYEKEPGMGRDDGLEGLDRVRLLMRLLGNPQRHFNSIVVAGTNGKGSVSAVMESILRQDGYRTGLYTSPHLHTFRERIRVDGEMISPADLAHYTEVVQEVVSRIIRLMEPSLVPTTYEITTAIAFLHFREVGVDMAVLEVGLGGRLDAVNIVTPVVSVLTAISLDHTRVLGNTIAEIAREKAGIIKDEGNVITAPQVPEAMTVIKQVAAEHRASLAIVGRDPYISGDKLPEMVSDEEGIPIYQSFDIGFKSEVEDVPDSKMRVKLPLLGGHQQINAAIAMAAMRTLNILGMPISGEAVLEGIERVVWPGRMEVIQRDPLVMADGAHNPASMTKLKQAMGELFHRSRLIIVLGLSSDKDIEGFIYELYSWSGSILGLTIEHVIVTRSQHPRAADPGVVLREVERRQLKVEVVDTVPGALLRAEGIARGLSYGGGDRPIVLVTGSLFVVAEAREYFGLKPDLSEELA
ncbi:MAG: bifunctional folylpolyglutamate synthase/dihydrofolate synthase [Chloroflexota bacterium]|nr:bifunctional folylpolyglutamate synthase/dihydrofolate synthase [Chloroflexota bacterium]